jgi:hypothetical protein
MLPAKTVRLGQTNARQAEKYTSEVISLVGTPGGKEK